jgi:hypothetical protein
MKQSLAVILLGALAVGPALRLPCLFACSAVDEHASRESCHSQASPEAVLAGIPDCAGDTLPAALVTKRAQGPSPAVVVTSNAVRVERPSPTTAGSAIVADPAPSPPLTSFLTPLRI